MSGHYSDYYDNLPDPVKENYYHQTIDYYADDAEWRPIIGYPGYYISREGEVLSLVNSKYRILKTWPNQYGHQYVSLSNEFGKTKVSVHRLVAQAFLQNPRNAPAAMHLDDDPTNNCANNLKWCTIAENNLDCRQKGRNFTKSVYCFKLDRYFGSCAEAADYFGVNRSLITMCCEGKNLSLSFKYHLCYSDEIEEKKSNYAWLMKRGRFKPLKAINIYTREVLYFTSRQAASEYLNVSDSGISSCIAGRLRQFGGWIFEDYTYEGGDIEWMA